MHGCLWRLIPLRRADSRGAAWVALAAKTACLALALLAAATHAATGEQAAPASGESVAAAPGCFWPRPLPGCQTFFVAEMQFVRPFDRERHDLLGATTYTRQAFFYDRLEWNLGVMVNLTPRHALGGVATAGLGGDYSVLGLKLRGRRWLQNDWSADLETGVLFAHAYSSWTRGLTLGTRMNFRDRVSVSLRWDGLEVPQDPLWADIGFQHTLAMGVGLGRRPAVIGTGVVGVAMLLMLGLAGGGS